MTNTNIRTGNLIRDSQFGPMWTLDKLSRQSAPIPAEMRLSQADIEELAALGVEDPNKNHESWVRLHGIGRFFKRDKTWYDNYPVSRCKA